MSPLFIGAANSTNRLLGNQSSNPGSPQAGDRYYNTTDNEFRVYDGTNWVALNAALGSSSTNPARNAAAIYNLGERTNGYYHIGTIGSSRLVYCVLDANFMSGGGWMIVANHDGAKEQDAGHQPRVTARSDQSGSDDQTGVDPGQTSMVPEKSFSVNMNGVPYTKFAHVVYASSNMSSINTSNMLNPLGYYAGTFNSEQTLPTTASYSTNQFNNRGVTLQMNGSNLNRRHSYAGSYDWCNYFGVCDANSGGTGTLRLNGSGATAANYPVYIGFQAFSSGLATYTFSFTDSANSNGFDDFQDGSGMGDNWAIEGVGGNAYRGNPSYIMLQ